MKSLFTIVALTGLVLGLGMSAADAQTERKFLACKFGYFYDVTTAHCVACKTYVSDEVALAKCRNCKSGMVWDIHAKKCTHIHGGMIR